MIMVLDTTYYNKDHKQLINDLVGPSFPLMQRFKMNGVGSKRMIVDEVSPNMANMMNLVSDINYANIELRPNGILIMINNILFF